MRSRHELLVVAVAVCGVLGGTRLLSAQEAPPPTAAAAPPAAAPAEATAPPAADAAKAAEEDAADAAEEKAAAPPAKPVGATPGRFEPTEKVRADFDVSFPIDI